MKISLICLFLATIVGATIVGATIVGARQTGYYSGVDIKSDSNSSPDESFCIRELVSNRYLYAKNSRDFQIKKSRLEIEGKYFIFDFKDILTGIAADKAVAAGACVEQISKYLDQV